VFSTLPSIFSILDGSFTFSLFSLFVEFSSVFSLFSCLPSIFDSPGSTLFDIPEDSIISSSFFSSIIFASSVVFLNNKC